MRAMWKLFELLSPLFSPIRGPFRAIKDEIHTEVDLDEVILPVVDSFYKPRFTEKDRVNSDSKIILAARDEAKKENTVILGFGPFKLKIKKTKRMNRIYDYSNKPWSRLVKEETVEYIPRLYDFLESNSRFLLDETPNGLLGEFGVFFDELLLEYVKFKLHTDFKIKINEEFHREVGKICSELLIGKDIKKLCERELQWNTCFEEIMNMMENNYNKFTENLMNEKADPIND